MYKPLPDFLTIRKSPIKDIKIGEELTTNYNLYAYPKTRIGLQTF